MVNYYPKGVERAFHAKADCIGRNCVIHNPSAHHMHNWDINIRTDREYALAERLCPHGVGHPDPDALAFIRLKVDELRYLLPPGLKDKPYGPFASDIHGCDGCCSQDWMELGDAQS